MQHADTLITDPHNELGVPEGACQREIKAAYRRLAAYWHPDRNPHPQAAERMKRINLAYQRIFESGNEDESDDIEPTPRAPRAWWDRDWGSARWEPDGVKRAGAIKHEITLRLEEAAFGCAREVSGEVVDLCASCCGVGRLVSRRADCRACDGQGRVQSLDTARWRRCSSCLGDGADRKRCEVCEGSGLCEAPRIYHYEVRIPPGVRDGHIVMLREQGQRGAMQLGNVELRIHVRPHELFSFDAEQRLTCRVPVDFYRSLGFGVVEVPTLDGRIIPVDLKPGSIQMLEGLGFPNRDGTRGPLVVELHTVMPSGYSTTQQALLRQLAEDLRKTKYSHCEELAAWHKRLGDWQTKRTAGV